MIKVSIIIPIYKDEPYVERCIRSVLRQTYRNLEVILVDDCTPDRSMEIAKGCIQELECSDLEFKFLRHECNRGLSAARNTGTAAAKGEYIYYMDSDDEIIPECIEKMVDVTKKYPDVEVVQGYNTIISQIAQEKKEDAITIKSIDYIDDNNWIREHYFCWDKRIHVTAWNKLIRSDFIRKNFLYFKEGVLHEDILWMFYVAKKLRKYSVVNVETYIHYIVPNTITTSTPSIVKAKHISIIIDDVLKNFDEPYYDRQVAIYLSLLINHFDDIEEERHTYHKLANKFGAILFKRKQLYLSLLLIIYVYSQPINKQKKGKWRLLGNLHKLYNQ